jgi:hypothetical protein
MLTIMLCDGNAFDSIYYIKQIITCLFTNYVQVWWKQFFLHFFQLMFKLDNNNFDMRISKF